MLRIDVFDIASFRQESYESLMAEIPVEEQRYVRRYRNREDNLRGLAVRLLLKEAMTEYGGVEFMELKRDEGNKPYVEGWMPFSIAHSGNYAVLAYSDSLNNVGIDIEEKKEIEITDVVDLFHKEEKNYIKQSIKSKDTFYEMWARKEAVLKAAGIGIVEGLDTFSCLSTPLLYKEKEYSALTLNISPDYAACAAAPGQLLPHPKLKFKHRFNSEKIKV